MSESQTRVAQTQSWQVDEDDEFPGSLQAGEYYWRDHQSWLKENGYLLRPRYDPEWKPSWNTTKEFFLNCEDGQHPWRFRLLDATRLSDGAHVMLKRVKVNVHVEEAAIGQFFQTPELQNDPQNHCVPVFDVLPVPDNKDEVIIAQLLLRPWDNPPFDSVNEVMDFFKQVIEGVCFMHRHRVAHRDIKASNIMMDAAPMYPDFYHPIVMDRTLDYTGKARYTTRTRNPPKYYLTDFGISKRLDPEANLESVVDEIHSGGGDKDAPEQSQETTDGNPFATDVYHLGSMILQHFVVGKKRFEFIEPVIEPMMHDIPKERPTMEEVLLRFNKLRASLSSQTLNSRVANHDENAGVTVIKDAIHHGKRLLRITGYLK